MPVPADTLANRLGNAMDWLQSQPEVSKLGLGMSLAFDIVQSVPAGMDNMNPHYAYEEPVPHGVSAAEPNPGP